MKAKSPARDPEFERLIRAQLSAFAKNTPYHSLELNDGRVIPGIIPVENLRARLDAYPIPRDLSGKRVLDIGAASGWNSFELERRGAEVVAVDCVEYEEFRIAHRLLESTVDYRILDVDELSVDKLGTFDHVLFFGVLYHLRHPLLALENICAMTRDSAFVESFVVDDAPSAECYLEFYETDELGGQIDNWCGPTTHCLMSLCRSAGFARAELMYNNDRRAGVTCYRRLDSAPDAPTAKAPLLCFAVNNRHDDAYFQPKKDEYICLYLRTDEPLRRGNTLVEIDDCGAAPLAVAQKSANEWQVNLRVPPGLEPGAHTARVRTPDSAFSNGLKIFMLPESHPGQRPIVGGGNESPVSLADGPLEMLWIENTRDRSTVFLGHRVERLSCHFKKPDAELDVHDVQLRIDDEAVAISALGRTDEDVWQINARIDFSTLKAGEHVVRIRRSRGDWSRGVSFSYAPDTWMS